MNGLKTKSKMARITIESIAEELKADGWKVLSMDYQNLDTEMEFQCSEGHKVFAPWKKIRTKRECPVCKQNKLKDPSSAALAKKFPKGCVLALDQSTNKTGFSIFHEEELLHYGVYSAKGSNEAERIHDLKEWLISMVAAVKPILVAIEGIQFQQNIEMGVTTFQALARLQGVLIDACLELKLPCTVNPTNTWRNHCGVKGRSRADKKKSMQLLVKQWYDVSVTDDEADAIGIGKYAASKAGRGMNIVEWE